MKKIITLVALLSISHVHGMRQEKKLGIFLSPITCQIASSVTGYFLSSIAKSVIPNDTIRGGVAVLGLIGGIIAHKMYFQPAVVAYKSSTKNDEPMPLVQTVGTFALNAAAWAAIWSSPALIEKSLTYLDKASLKNPVKVAAPAALIAYASSVVLD